MSGPDFTRGYLRLPLPVWLAVFCRAPLTRRQLQLVSVVLRESWGWQTAQRQVHLWTRPLTTRQFAVMTGLPTDHLRQDLERLIIRGVLRRDGDRYQFVVDTKLWTTLDQSSPKSRCRTPEWSDYSAEIALPNLASKKGHRKERNGREAFESELSPTVENPSSRSSSPRVVQPSSAVAEVGATAARRLADIITAFVGALSPHQAEILRQWIAEVGVAVVWSALEPAFRLGSTAGRRRLIDILSTRSGV